MFGSFKRLAKWLGPRVRRSPMLLAVGATVGFVVVLAAQLQPSEPESRLPDQYRLTALIERQQKDNEEQRRQTEALRNEVEDLRSVTLDRRDDQRGESRRLAEAGVTAGLVPMRGTGFTVTLDDSSFENSPTGNVNDLVIHSQDVQAVVNGLWAGGAEAIAINGQRLVATSAVLCVGNTLLINGTVHAPPYNISSIGTEKSKFNSDGLVRQVREDAERFSLGFSVSKDQSIEIPGYTGSTNLEYAQKKS